MKRRLLLWACAALVPVCAACGDSTTEQAEVILDAGDDIDEGNTPEDEPEPVPEPEDEPLVANLIVEVVGDGSVIGADGAFACGQAGESCESTFPEGSMASLTALPGTGARFEGWGGDCTGEDPMTSVILESADREWRCTATFGDIPDMHTLTVLIDEGGSITSNPAGIDCGEVCDAIFEHGTMIQLDVGVAPGFRFAGWGGDCAGANNPYFLIIEDTHFCSARMAPIEEKRNTLTVAVVGPGNVTSEPAGIDCAEAGEGVCEAEFDDRRQVTLTAAVEEGSAVRWLGCEGVEGPVCTLTMEEDRRVDVEIVPPPRGRVEVEIEGLGRVTSDPAGIDCGEVCTATFDFDTALSLTAQPEEGHLLAAWGGDCAEAEGDTAQLLVEGDLRCTLRFEPLPETCVPPPPYDPLDPIQNGLPVEGLRLWLRADTGLSLDGAQRVCVWEDQSGQQHHFAQTTPEDRPHLADVAIAGHPALDYRGQDETMTREGLLGIPADSGRVIFVVGRYNEAHNQRQKFFAHISPGSNSHHVNMEVNTHDTLGRRFGLYAFGAYDTSATIDTDPHIHAIALETMARGASITANLSYRLDGRVFTVGGMPDSLRRNDTPHTTFPGFLDGAATHLSTAAHTLDGHLAEVIVYEGPLSDALFDAVESYLADRYGIVVE